MPKIDEDSAEPVLLTGSFKTWTLTEGTTISTGSYASAISDEWTSTNNVINILGTAANTSLVGSGMGAGGNELELNIGATGKLIGFYGLYVTGDEAVVRNAGLIRTYLDDIESNYFGDGMGVGQAVDSKIFNSGTIYGRSGINIDQAVNFRIVNEKGGEITGAGTDMSSAGIYMSSGTSGMKITNHGVISAPDTSAAIILLAGDDTVFNDGTIRGLVNLGTGADQLTNERRILGGVVFSGLEENKLANKGMIGIGIDMAGGNDTIVNSGSIGDDVNLDAGNNKLTNSGDIDGNVTTTSGTVNTIVNTGRIRGDVMFGSAADTIDTRKGRIDGTITGEFGNDTLITDNRNYQLVEIKEQDVGGGTIVSGGFDTVKSTVSYTLNLYVEQLILLGTGNIGATGSGEANVLKGNSGDNTIKGLAGEDRIDGQKGDDTLAGGLDADRFLFGTGDGHDVITDFKKDGADILDLGDWKAIGSFRAFKSHAQDTAGGDVLVKAGNDSILIKDMHEADFGAADFSF